MIGFELPAWMQVDIDLQVLLFTLALALLTGILSGLAPAIHFVRESLSETLKEGGRGASSSRSATFARRHDCGRSRARGRTSCRGRIADSELLRVAVSEQRLRVDRISSFRVALGWKRYINQELTQRYYERALEKLKAIPGVEEAALVASPLARQEDNS
ncbi:MAG: hypothetical protein WKF37_13635 [Bryobacteraceae bacterium]